MRGMIQEVTFRSYSIPLKSIKPQKQMSGPFKRNVRASVSMVYPDT